MVLYLPGYLGRFESVESAMRAKEALDGADIYAGCCTLRIEFSKVNNCNIFIKIVSVKYCRIFVYVLD